MYIYFLQKRDFYQLILLLVKGDVLFTGDYFDPYKLLGTICI